MSYTVDWTRAARRQLAAVWVQHPPYRRAITAAQARIDRLLAVNPHGSGTPLSEGLFVIESLPLRAAYEIVDATRRVKVESVGWVP